jgi:hypothetical protein
MKKNREIAARMIGIFVLMAAMHIERPPQIGQPNLEAEQFYLEPMIELDQPLYFI